MIRQCQTRFSVVLAAAFAFGLPAAGPPRGSAAERKAYVNHAGVRMVPIPAGRFLMGNNLLTDPKMLGQISTLMDGDYDEKPAHEVRISRDFHISETEITAGQFARFRFDYQTLEDPRGAVAHATGVRVCHEIAAPTAPRPEGAPWAGSGPMNPPAASG
jgi:formylglycine-generating enzyme required for sulfatase activity